MVKKKYDELIKNWKGIPIPNKDFTPFTKCLHPFIDYYITKKGLHNRETIVFLRAIKKVGKQERKRVKK